MMGHRIGSMQQLFAMHKTNSRNTSSSPDSLDITQTEESRIAELSQEYSFAPAPKGKVIKDNQTNLNTSTTKTNTYTNALSNHAIPTLKVGREKFEGAQPVSQCTNLPFPLQPSKPISHGI